MAKKIPVSCPQCDTVLTLKKSWMGGWQKERCPKCGYIVTPEAVRNAAAYCPICDKNVQIDLLKGDDRCPICGSEVEMAIGKNLTEQVKCPHCFQIMEVERGTTGQVTCLHCHEVFKIGDGEASFGGLQAIRISNSEMDDDSVLWLFPQKRLSPDSVLSIKAGTAAMLVSGDRCIRMVNETGRTLESLICGEANPEEISIVYVRPLLKGCLAWGGQVRLRDSRYRVKEPIGVHGNLYLKITDIPRFAKKVNYSPCTEYDLNLFPEEIDETEQPYTGKSSYTGNPIMINGTEVLEKACMEVLREESASLLQLADYEQDIKNRFQQLLNEILSAEWGIRVTVSRFGKFPEIEVGKLTAVETNNLRSRVCREISWKTPDIRVNMRDNKERYAILEVNGTAMLDITDETFLRNSQDAFRWEIDVDEMLASSEIGKQLGVQLYDVLQSYLQSYMNQNENNRVEDLPLYLNQLNRQLMGSLNGDKYYLAQRGLQVSTLTVRLQITEKSSSLKKWEEKNEVRGLHDMQREIDEEKYRERVEQAQRTSTEKREVFFGTLDADEAIEQRKHAWVMRQKEYEDELKRKDLSIQQGQAVMEEQQNNELESIRNQNRQNIEQEQIEYQLRIDRLKSDYDREMKRIAEEHQHILEMSASQHEAALQEVLVGIEQGRLSWQEKLDAYARAKELNDALNSGDVGRVKSTAEIDINQMVNEGKINITRQAQELMAEAAKLKLETERAASELEQRTEQVTFELEKTRKEAEFDLNERRTQAEFVREMQREQEKIRSDFERLKLELDQRDKDRAAETERRLLQGEIQKLELTMKYMEQIESHKLSAEIARENAAAARKKAEEEFNERRHQEAREEREKESLNQKQWEHNYKISEERIEKMLKQVKKLRGQVDSINSNMEKNEEKEKSDQMTKQLQQLEEAIADLRKSPSYACNPYVTGNGNAALGMAPLYEGIQPAGYGRPAATNFQPVDNSQLNGFSNYYGNLQSGGYDVNSYIGNIPMGQPGFGTGTVCPKCGIKLNTGVRACPVCGFWIG